MSFYTPFAFIQSAAVVPANVPPYSPYAFYDATNTLYTSASVWNDVVSEGANNRALKPLSGTPTYVSGQYYEFTSDNLELTGSTALSEFMNNLAGYEHTKIALIYPTSTTEEDFMSGASTITMLFSGTSPAANAVRGHVFSSGGTLVTDSSISTTTSTWWFGGQRFSTSSASVGRVDVISGAAGSLPGTITNGSNGGWAFDVNGDSRFIIGSRNLPVRGFFDGRIAQVVVYDKALSDSEVQEVLDWMKDHQGL